MSYRTDADYKAVADTVPVFCAHDKIVDVKKLIPNPLNPNKHPKDQIELLARIIEQTGWRAPITVSTASGYVVKGHGRLMAAKFKGWKRVPVDYQNYSSEAEEYADLVADNRIAELAELDQQKLAEIFGDIQIEDVPIELTGYSDEEADMLQAALNSAMDREGEAEDDSCEEEPPADPKAKRGDVYILGPHRLMCGDATSTEDMAKLMGGNKADPCSASCLDLFGGTSATMIACEQLGRKCYMMELDPSHVDVIVDRWEKNTGDKAVKI